MDDPTTELMQGLQSLFKSSECSDLTIICGPKTFNVHKAVICPRSAYFATICQKGRFKEGDEGVIRLKAISSDQTEDENAACDDPDIVEDMIYYFYHLEYISHYSAPADALPITVIPLSSGSSKAARRRDKKRDQEAARTLSVAGSSSVANVGNIVHHAEMFAIAVKYQIISLQKVATSRFRRAAEWVRDDELARAARVVYASTPEDKTELREIVDDLTNKRKAHRRKAKAIVDAWRLQ